MVAQSEGRFGGALPLFMPIGSKFLLLDGLGPELDAVLKLGLDGLRVGELLGESANMIVGFLERRWVLEQFSMWFGRHRIWKCEPHDEQMSKLTTFRLHAGHLLINLFAIYQKVDKQYHLYKEIENNVFNLIRSITRWIRQYRDIITK